MKALLDTHVLLWWLEGGKKLSRQQKRVIDRAGPDSPLGVSDISLWEIAARARAEERQAVAIELRTRVHPRTARCENRGRAQTRRVDKAAQRIHVNR